MTLDMDYRAHSVEGDATPINMTNHTYFNLNKAKNEESIIGTEINICSDRPLEVTKRALIPAEKTIERDIATFESPHLTTLDSNDPVYDFCFIVDANKYCTAQTQ